MTGGVVWLWPVLVGYGLGSIPFGWLLVRCATGLDLRRIGSGNVGATNALRTTRWRTGLVIALLDLAKGSAAVGLVGLGGGDLGARALGGLAAIVGHMFPVWLRFQGGKGVATACGVFGVLAPWATGVAAAVFLAVALATRLVSLASLTGTGVLAGMSLRAGVPRQIAFAALAAGTLVVWRHAPNIRRLLRGTERRIGDDTGTG